MEILVNQLKVLEHGSIVLSKDSSVDFRLDPKHIFSLKFVTVENEPSKIDFGGEEGDRVTIRCVNFGEKGTSQGLERPFSVLKLGTGNHLLLQFAMLSVGASRVLFYTWYTENDTQNIDEKTNVNGDKG